MLQCIFMAFVPGFTGYRFYWKCTEQWYTFVWLPHLRTPEVFSFGHLISLIPTVSKRANEHKLICWKILHAPIQTKLLPLNISNVQLVNQIKLSATAVYKTLYE